MVTLGSGEEIVTGRGQDNVLYHDRSMRLTLGCVLWKTIDSIVINFGSGVMDLSLRGEDIESWWAGELALS